MDMVSFVQQKIETSFGHKEILYVVSASKILSRYKVHQLNPQGQGGPLKPAFWQVNGIFR